MKPVSESREPADDASPSGEPDKITDLSALNLSATKGRPVLFMVMTCGFIACMACVVGTFVAIYLVGHANGLW